MDPSGLMRFDLGEGPIEVELRSRDDGSGSVTYLLLSTYTGVRLSIAVRSAEHARLLSAGALAIADEELSRSRDSPPVLLPSGMDDKIRDRILEAARKIGKTRGFALAAKDVAAEAGIAEASLFRRFKRKDKLLEALLVEMLEDADPRLIEIVGSEASAQSKIRAINNVGFEHVGRYGRLACEVTGADFPEELNKHLPTIHRLWRLMGRVIKRGIEQGQFRDTNVRMCVIAWLALVSPGSIAAYETEGRIASPEEMSRVVSDFLIAGLRKVE